MLTLYANPNSYAWKYAIDNKIKCKPISEVEDIEQDSSNEEAIEQVDNIRAKPEDSDSDYDGGDSELLDLWISYEKEGDLLKSEEKADEAINYYL